LAKIELKIGYMMGAIMDEKFGGFVWKRL